MVEEWYNCKIVVYCICKSQRKLRKIYIFIKRFTFCLWMHFVFVQIVVDEIEAEGREEEKNEHNLQLLFTKFLRQMVNKNEILCCSFLIDSAPMEAYVNNNSRPVNFIFLY